MSRLARPVRGPRTFALAVVVLALWAAVAHQSGSGWVQAVGAVVAALVAVGLLAPAIAASSLRLEVGASPADATAGTEVRVQVTCNRAARLVPVSPGGLPTAVAAGEPGTVALLPPRRQAMDTIVLDAATSWPFGLLWWSRRIAVALPHVLYVAPRPGAPLEPAQLLAEGGDEKGRRPSEAGERRSVRAYRPGDDPRRVHWPLSAHAGELMVAEHDPGSERTPVRLRALLPEDNDEAERRAGRVLASAGELLARGRAVLLETDEPGPHRVTAEVRSVREAGRRLARAVTAATPATAVPAPGTAAAPRRPSARRR